MPTPSPRPRARPLASLGRVLATDGTLVDLLGLLALTGERVRIHNTFNRQVTVGRIQRDGRRGFDLVGSNTWGINPANVARIESYHTRAVLWPRNTGAPTAW